MKDKCNYPRCKETTIFCIPGKLWKAVKILRGEWPNPFKPAPFDIYLCQMHSTIFQFDLEKSLTQEAGRG